MENYTGAAQKLATLNLERLSPYERGKVEQINFNIEHDFSDDLKLNVMAGSAESVYDKPTETTIIMDKLNVDGYSWDYRNNRRLPAFNYGIDPLNPAGWTFAEVRLRPQFVSNTFENLQADLKWTLTDRF